MQRYNTLLLLAKIKVTTESTCTVFQGDITTWDADDATLLLDYGDGIHEVATRSLLSDGVSHTYPIGEYVLRIIGDMHFGASKILTGLNGEISYIFLNGKNFKTRKPDGGELYDFGNIQIGDSSLTRVGIIDTVDNPRFIQVGTAPSSAANDPLPYLCMPKSNESHLSYISGTTGTITTVDSRAGAVSRNMLFDSNDNANALTNKMEGAVLECPSGSPSDSISHAFALSENKSINKILYSNTTHNIQYTPSEKTITLSNDGSGAEVAKQITNEAIKIEYADGTYDTDYFTAVTYRFSCFSKGTKITLYDGTQKNVEDIAYDDLLLTWDFLTGQFKIQFPFFIKAPHETIGYIELQLEDGNVFNLVGEHGIYDVKNKKIVWIDTKNYKDLDLTDFLVWELTNDGLMPKKIKTIQYVESNPVEYYTILTSGTQTCFTNNILTCGNQFWNLTGNISNENQFDMTLFNTIKNNKQLQYTYEQFEKQYGKMSSAIYYGNIYDIIIGGMLYGADLHGLTREDVDSAFVNGMQYFWNDAKPFIQQDGKDVYYIALRYKNGDIVKQAYAVNSEIALPETKNGWYNVSNTEVYKDTMMVKVSTVLEEI